MNSKILALTAFAALTVIAGCSDGPASSVSKPVTAGSSLGAAAELEAQRSKLNADDRKLVEAQEWCVVQSDERLGSMGPPIKLTIKDTPVFICCGGCRRSR